MSGDPDHEPPTKPYHENPSMYEQACLREVMKGLAGLPLWNPRKLAPRNVYAVRLTGEYPHTRLEIVLSRGGPRVCYDWGLWGHDFGEVLDEANRAGPGLVASDVVIQVYEHS